MSSHASLDVPNVNTDSNISGSEVPLGILSAWEPCGAILCANLPVVYRVLVRGLKQLRSTARSGTRWSWSWSWSRPRRGLVGLDSGNSKGNGNDGGDATLGRPDTHTSQKPLYHHWTRMDSEGGGAGADDLGGAGKEAGLFPTAKVSAEMRHADGEGSELGTFGDSRIMVERSFSQDFDKR